MINRTNAVEQYSSHPNTKSASNKKDTNKTSKNNNKM